MRKVLLLLPLLAGVAASPASAAAPGFSARVEGRVGYDEVRPKFKILDEAQTNDFGISNVSYGAEAGIDLGLTERLLVGAYGGIDFSRVDGCKNNIIPDFTPADRGCADAGTSYTAGIRAGVDPGGGLIYVKGGYSHGKFSVDYSCDPALSEFCPDPVTDPNLLLATRDSVNGWHIGAGVELDVTRNIYLKAEYLHHRYGRMRSDLADAFDTDQARISREQIMFGVGFRFGRMAPPPPPPPPPSPPPPPPAPPATRSCPDGSVVLASDPCPAPPPPPPPPPPAPERG